MRIVLARQAVCFGLVGCVGFAVDGGLLYLLVSVGADPWAVRLVSFPVAVVVTWYLNRRFTFDPAANADKRREFGRYAGVQVAGAFTNYLVYLALLPITGVSAGGAFLAFVFGSAVGLLTNFFGARWLVFRRSTGSYVATHTPN